MRKRKLALSGGRTSAFMLRKLMDQYGAAFDKEFTITFCNTGKEFDATLDFVRDIGQKFGVEIIWLEYTRVPAIAIDPFIYPHKKSQKTVIEQQQRGETTHWFTLVDWNTARRNGTPNTPFDELLGWCNVLPNVRTRICSVQMKVRTMMRYLFSLGVYTWEDFIGIRADEAHRALEIQANCPKYIGLNFPLIDLSIGERDVLDFWSKQDFDLNLKSHEGNCDQCFLKRKSKRVQVARDHPQSVIWWEDWEKKFAAKEGIKGDGKYFRLNEPYAGIRFIAQNQRDLFEDSEDIPCGCGDKGFVIAANEDSELEK